VKIDFISLIKLRHNIAFWLIIFYSGSCLSDLQAQNISKPTRQSSIEAFSDGKYEIAYSQFTELLISYPKDPLYKYYAGVCLVNLKKDPDKASALLQQAIESAGVIKSLPSDALFYLGRAQQLSGQFVQAITSYLKFGDSAGRKVAKEYEVQAYIQECNAKTGNLPQAVVEAKENMKVESIVKAVPDTVKPVEKTNIIINNPPLPVDYEKLIDDGLKFQIIADSLRGIPSPQNNSLAVSYQKEADRKFNEAEILKPGSTALIKVVPPSVPIEAPVAAPIVESKQDSIIVVPKEPVIVREVFSVFEVVEKPVYTSTDKIAIDPVVPEGLIYRIQMAVFRNPVAPSYFKGITPINGFRVAGKDITIYYAGMFRRSVDASKALSVVKSKGFKDSFVVSFSGSKSISSERAAAMEKDWGIIPLFREADIAKETVIDTVPPTLSFRIEVNRTEKPLSEDVVEGMTKIAGSRGLDIFTDEKGRFVYLIGKFITFESAAEYNDLLVRNGYRESKVGAWMERNEVPIETAKQLFEKLE
jgi:hypothetical protein